MNRDRKDKETRRKMYLGWWLGETECHEVRCQVSGNGLAVAVEEPNHLGVSHLLGLDEVYLCGSQFVQCCEDSLIHRRKAKLRQSCAASICNILE